MQLHPGPSCCSQWQSDRSAITSATTSVCQLDMDCRSSYRVWHEESNEEAVQCLSHMVWANCDQAGRRRQLTLEDFPTNVTKYSTTAALQVSPLRVSLFFFLRLFGGRLYCRDRLSLLFYADSISLDFNE